MIGLYVSIALVIVPIAALVIGFFRNWAFSLIHFVLFALLGVGCTYLCSEAIIPAVLESQGITYDYLANYLASTIASINEQLTSYGSQIDVEFVLFGDAYVDQAYYVEVIKTILFELAIIIGCIAGAVIGYGLTWLIYIPLKKKFFNKENYKKKLSHRFIAAGVSLVCFLSLSVFAGASYSRIAYFDERVAEALDSVQIIEDENATVQGFQVLDVMYVSFEEENEEDLDELNSRKEKFESVIYLKSIKEEKLDPLMESITELKGIVDEYGPILEKYSGYAEIAVQLNLIDEEYSQYIDYVSGLLEDGSEIDNLYNTIVYYYEIASKIAEGEEIKAQLSEINAKLKLVKQYINGDLADGNFLSFLGDFPSWANNVSYNGEEVSLNDTADDFYDEVTETIRADAEILNAKLEEVNTYLDQALTYLNTNFSGVMDILNNYGIDEYIEYIEGLINQAEETEETVQDEIDSIWDLINSLIGGGN